MTFKTKKQFVHDAQGMTLTAGWREIFIPEVKALRDTILNDMIYGANAAEEVLANRASIRVLDELLSFESRIAEMAADLKNDPQDEGNVVQSAAEAVSP